MAEREFKLSGVRRVTQKTYQETGSVSVTVLPGTERAGFSVVKVTGERDDDQPWSTAWNWCREEVIEVYEQQEPAERRVEELNGADAYEDIRPGGGEETWVGSWREYRVGSCVLRLCIVEGEE